MTNQEIMDLADQYLYDTSGKNYGIIEFARAIESRTRATVIGEWFQEGKKVEREVCAAIANLHKNEWKRGDSNAAIALCNLVDAIRARGE